MALLFRKLWRQKNCQNLFPAILRQKKRISRGRGVRVKALMVPPLKKQLYLLRLPLCFPVEQNNCLSLILVYIISSISGKYRFSRIHNIFSNGKPGICPFFDGINGVPLETLGADQGAYSTKKGFTYPLSISELHETTQNLQNLLQIVYSSVKRVVDMEPNSNLDYGSM